MIINVAVPARAAGGLARPAELVAPLHRVRHAYAIRPFVRAVNPQRGESVCAAIAFTLELGQVDGLDCFKRHRAALRRARPELRPDLAPADPVPCWAVVVLLAAHPRDVPAWQVAVSKALEEWGDSRAAQEHEHVVGGGGDVGAAPGLDGEAVAAAAEDDGVAGGEVGVVEGEGTVGVVDVEDTVGPRGDVEHEDVVDAEEEVAESRVAAAVLEGEGVVDGDVAAVGSARRDVERGRVQWHY